MNILKLLSLYLLFICSCTESSQKVHDSNHGNVIDTISSNVLKNEYAFVVDTLESIEEMYQYALNFNPENIDLSIDLLAYVDSGFFNSKDIKIYVFSEMILLKLSIFHFQHSNQSYNLIPMRKGLAKKIIDYYLINNKIDTLRPFVPSHIVGTIEMKRNQLDSNLDSLVKIYRYEFNK